MSLTSMIEIIPIRWWIFLISMVPIVELRGALPVGVLAGIPFWQCYFICVAGNLLPVPFLMMFSKALVTWLATWKGIGPFFQRLIAKADREAQKMSRYELIGLCIFVAIPLPGTGAWTGSLVATMLRLRPRDAFISIAVGVIISGLIVGALSLGIEAMVMSIS